MLLMSWDALFTPKMHQIQFCTLLECQRRCTSNALREPHYWEDWIGKLEEGNGGRLKASHYNFKFSLFKIFYHCIYSIQKTVKCSDSNKMSKQSNITDKVIRHQFHHICKQLHKDHYTYDKTIWHHLITLNNEIFYMHWHKTSTIISLNVSVSLFIAGTVCLLCIVRYCYSLQ